MLRHDENLPVWNCADLISTRNERLDESYPARLASVVASSNRVRNQKSAPCPRCTDAVMFSRRRFGR
jgi:hypothetical protein